MKKISGLALGAVFALGVAAAVSSCSEENGLIGSWTSAAPQPVVPTVMGTVSATQVTTIDFQQGTDKSSGPIKLTSDYTVTLPADTLGNPRSCTVSASVEGKWTRSDKDKDDYYIAFDRNSLDVNAVGADELGPITDSFLVSLSRYTTIEDVEVNKERTNLVFEIENPDENLHFIRVK